MPKPRRVTPTASPPGVLIAKGGRSQAAEELVNSLTHGIGLLLSLVGMVVLIVLAAKQGDAWHVASCAVYGTTLVLLYAASTFYHRFHRSKASRVLKAMDHAAIFLLIAGTYTPFTLVTLRGAWGWTMFGVVWALAVAGILLHFLMLHGLPLMTTLLYLGMGWLGVVAAKPMTKILPTPALLLLLAGGLSYTAGLIFFPLKRVPYRHAVWHVFVLAGSAFHYFAVLYFVVPPA